MTDGGGISTLALCYVASLVGDFSLALLLTTKVQATIPMAVGYILTAILYVILWSEQKEIRN